LVHRATGDLDQAIGDLDEAIKLDPKLAAAFVVRGGLYRDKDDLEHTIADYDEAIRLDAKNPNVFFARGRAFHDSGDLARAIIDFGEAVRLKPGDAYPVLWLYFVRERVGNRAAVSELEQNAQQLKRTDWPYPVVELYLGQRTPDATLSAPTKPNDRCEAQFYIGEWQLLRADRAAAAVSLKAAVDTCPKDFVEFTGARAELKRLGQ
jgi:lipoprotein NlpI